LSSGERQRCALARALLNRPKLLLADEPTGNLDTENADTVLASMREFVADGGAVLLVTHDDRAAAAADSILWMNRGTLLDSQPLQAK
jgi:ABC-type lipoprotein export system ATPase subunit